MRDSRGERRGTHIEARGGRRAPTEKKGQLCSAGSGEL